MRSLLGGIINKTPVAYVGSGRLSIPFMHRNDAAAQMAAMGSVGTLFAIVNRTSTATAQACWHLYRKAKSGLPEDRVEITKHAALDLWNKPNPFMTRTEFVESIQQHVDLTGEAWWMIARAANERLPEAMRSIPLELWPIRPDRMEPVPHPTDFLAGYVYTGPEGEKVPLELNQVIQLRMPNPLDPYRGMGPVQSLLTDLDSARYSAEWNRNFFRNSAEPGGIIEVDKRLGDDEFDEMTTRWNEQHRGVANAHRVAVIEQGKWVNRTFTMRDMQFAELRHVTRDVIMEAFGFPKSMIGATDDVNRANAEAGEYVFAKWLAVPRLERIKTALNNDLLPLFGATAEGLEFDYDSPVPDDEAAENAARTSKTTAYKTLIDAGVDPDDAADVVGLPKMRIRTAPAPAPAAAAPVLGLNVVRTALRAELSARPTARACTHRRSVLNVDETDIPEPPDGVPAEAPEVVEAIDLSPVQEAFETALAGLLATWMGSVVVDWIDALVDAVRAVLATGRLAELAQLSIDTSDATDELLDAMADLAEQSAGHVVDEAAEQDIDLDPVVPDRDELATRAETTAAFEGQRYATAAGKEAARIAGGELTDDEVADYVRAHLEELAESSARAPLAGALTGAQNTARAQTLRSGPVGALYASEVLDRNTCKPCRSIHGRWICNTDDLAVLWKLYPGSGYINCEGGYYCRGTFVGVWRPEQVKGDE